MKRCRCGHDTSRHELLTAAEVGERYGVVLTIPAPRRVIGPCAVTLPPLEEEELPAWRCPCTRFQEGRPSRWRSSSGPRWRHREPGPVPPPRPGVDGAL